MSTRGSFELCGEKHRKPYNAAACLPCEIDRAKRNPDESVRVLLPPKSVWEGDVRVVSFFDEAGDRHYTVIHDIDLPLSTCIGLLDLAKHDLIKRCGDRDDYSGEP